MAPPSLALGLRLERIRAEWKDPRDPARIKALEELWRSSRFQDDPRIFHVGNELTFYYFFKDKLPSERFSRLEDDLLERIRTFVAAEQRERLGDALHATLVNYYGQNLLLAAEAQRLHKDRRRMEQRVAQFKRFFAGKPFRLSLPPGSSRQTVQRLARIHRGLLGTKRPAAEAGRGKDVQPQGTLPVSTEDGGR